jgi:hypothetical protein
MAIFHLNLKIVTRGTGASAVAKAAYQSGDKLTNEYDGRSFDYARKSRVVYKEILLPDNAPREYYDRSTLWNAVEKIEKAKNAQLARNVELSLPVELSREQNISFLRQYVREQFVDKGMCADVCVHDSNDGNPHAHILLTMRPFNEDGTWADKFKKIYEFDEQGNKIYDPKTRRYKSRAVSVTDWNDRNKAEEWRAAWADAVNAELTHYGFAKTIDHRSFKRQGKDELPTVHLGVAVMQMERRGIRTERGDINRQVEDYNKKLRQINARIRKAEDWLDSNRGRVTTELRDTLQAILDDNNGTRWDKIYHLQLAAETLVFIQNNKISDIPEFIEKVKEMKQRCNALADKGRANERRLKTLGEHLRHSTNYKKYGKIKKHADALHTKWKELESKENIFTKGKTQKAWEEMDAYQYDKMLDIQAYNEAADYLKKHLNGNEFTTAVVDSWQKEQAALTADKNALLAEFNSLKGEIESTETLLKFAKQLMQKVEPQQEQQRKQEQEIQQPQRKKTYDIGR